jgi:hypothetical protein
MIGGLVVLMAVRTVGQDMERRLDG